METLNAVKSELTTGIILSKMLQSKKDARLAVINKIENGHVELLMDNVGVRVFPMHVINEGFKFLETNEEMVKAFFYNKYSPRNLFNPESLFMVACEIYDKLSPRFPNLTNVEISLYLKNIVNEINKKSEL